MNISQNEFLNKIKGAVFNLPHVHIADQKRVACIFYDLLKQNGEIDLGDIYVIKENLVSSFSESTKESTKHS